MKKQPRREPPPAPSTHDRRSRDRAQNADPFPNAPKAPDGVSGNWK